MKSIGVLEEGGFTSWHIPPPGWGGYDTLCGLDGNDSHVGTFGVIQGKNKITCIQCYDIWKGVKAMKYRESDFNPTRP